MIFSDASSSGIGGFFGSAGKVEGICYRNLLSDEQNKSSTNRELRAILFALRAFPKTIEGKSLLWHTDNLAAARIVKIGSNKPDLQHLSVLIFETCKDKNISFTATWICRNLNYQADEISKNIDYDDWKLSQKFFEHLNSLWGPFTLDNFAERMHKTEHRIIVEAIQKVLQEKQ